MGHSYVRDLSNLGFKALELSSSLKVNFSFSFPGARFSTFLNYPLCLSYMIEECPDVVVVILGGNDFTNMSSLSEICADCTAFYRFLRDKLPNAKVYATQVECRFYPPNNPYDCLDVHSFADDSNLHKSSSFQCQPSSNARSQSRLAMSSTINSDLQSISEWGTRNLVKFNTSKTQLLTISLSNTPSNYPIIFEDSEIPSLNSVNILGLQISSSLSWRDHIVQIAKSASKKLGVLFRCKQYFNSAQLFKLYTGFIRPCLEYCSHIWGSSPYTSLLDKIESKAISLIGDPSLTSTLYPLSLRRKVASLSLFYRYYFGHCSDELATCIPPPMARPRSTRQATFAHNYCVELSNARINRFSDGFFPSTSHLWNSLPSSVFPASFNLPSFKRQVYHHLRGQMA